MRIRDMTDLQLQILGCITPHCPVNFTHAVIRFSAWVQPNHTYCFGNQNSIFTGATEIAYEFTSYLLSCKHWYGLELVRHLEIDTLGKKALFSERNKVLTAEEARDAGKRPEVTLLNLPENLPFDLVEHAIFNAEEDIILALKLSFESSDYCFEGHLEYVAILRTTLKILEFFRTRPPQKSLAFIGSGDEVRLKPRAHSDHIVFCQLCWRIAKSNPSDLRNLPPKYCRPHNQNRSKVASTYFGIHSEITSKYRSALRKFDAFAEALNEMQLLVVAGTLVISRTGTVLGQIMRMRYIAHYVANNLPKH